MAGSRSGNSQPGECSAFTPGPGRRVAAEVGGDSAELKIIIQAQETDVD